MEKTALYRTIWRWHFYAGLFVIPFILILSITGSIYLFKPQLDRWQEREWRGFSMEDSVSADAQLENVMAAYPGATFHNYRVPQENGDAAMFQMGQPNGGGVRNIYVSPQGIILADIDPESRISNIVSRIHGTLLIGKWGGYLVELAASWAIVMILTGLYLWWPRNGGAKRARLAGIVWPRLGLGGRQFWKDIHSVAGFWVAGLALISLVSGLPWTDVWGAGFRVVRAEMGWTTQMPQDWKGGGAQHHGEHDHAAMAGGNGGGVISPSISLEKIVQNARRENLAFPAIIMPPGAPARFGPPNGADWKLTSEAQNRPLIRTITYDAVTGAESGRSGFAEKHVIDRIINYGIAWHEGQLLGLFNQLVGVFTALMLILLAITSINLWWKRRPKNMSWRHIGAPPPLPEKARLRGITMVIFGLAALLPMLAISIFILAVIDRMTNLVARSS